MISKEEFKKLEKLSKLSFSDEEFEGFLPSFESIVRFCGEVADYDEGEDEFRDTEPSPVPDTSDHPAPCPSYNTDEDGYFRIKRIM